MKLLKSVRMTLFAPGGYRLIDQDVAVVAHSGEWPVDTLRPDRGVHSIAAAGRLCQILDAVAVIIRITGVAKCIPVEVSLIRIRDCWTVVNPRTAWRRAAGRCPRIADAVRVGVNLCLRTPVGIHLSSHRRANARFRCVWDSVAVN